MEAVVQNWREQYLSRGIVKLDREQYPGLPEQSEIKSLADNIIAFAMCGSEASKRIDTTMEVIRVAKQSPVVSVDSNHMLIESRLVLTRLENFVAGNKEWNNLCGTGGTLSKIVGMVCSDSEVIIADENSEADSIEHEEWCLYKEKLNCKPAGGTGFAPHFDNPSLQVTGLCDRFITVMIAIDDMTVENGCLRVVPGNWSEENTKELCVDADKNHSNNNNADNLNPDGNGRRGAILPELADTLAWENIECKSGDVYIFNGWIPHRSGANTTQSSRRAVFLTYNSPEDGELREDYYRVMRLLRSRYQSTIKGE